MEKAWTESPSHRQNLLNSNFKEIGIAVVIGDFQGKETTIVVQLFGSPIAKPVAVNPIQSPKPISSPKPTSTPIANTSPLVETPVVILGQEQVPLETLNSEPLAEKEEFNLPIEILSFGSNKYDQITSKAVTFFLLFLVGVLIFNFLVNLIEGIKKPGLALDAAFFILLFFISNFIDKQLIISLIPHNLII